MLKHGFDMHQLFLSAPGDLEKERDACRSAISEVNSAEAMPLKILLVSVGLTCDDHVVGFRSAVADNIRQSAYYVQVFEDDWGPKNLFRKMFYLAIECRDDAKREPFPENVLSRHRVPRRCHTPDAGRRRVPEGRAARNRSRNPGLPQRARGTV